MVLVSANRIGPLATPQLCWSSGQETRVVTQGPIGHAAELGSLANTSSHRQTNSHQKLADLRQKLADLRQNDLHCCDTFSKPRNNPTTHRQAPMTELNSADDPWKLAANDAGELRERLGEASAAVVLGSGWIAVGEALGEPIDRMAMHGLGGVPAPSVAGHGGTITALDVGGSRVLVMAGRSHLYEGHPPHTVVHAVRTAVLAGCSTVVLTNAAGSLRPEVGVGSAVILSDQLNLTGTNAMAGVGPPPQLGGRFVDLSAIYSPRLRAAAHAADAEAVDGVYAGLLGGSYETPAEIRMLAGMGADVVGMSTVLESVAAKHLGAEVFGVALVTNLAAGLQNDLDHGEVLAAGAASADRLVTLLRAVLTEAPK